MTAFEFGDVVLVRFPFTNQSATKQRPAEAISSEAYHRARPDILIMAITSQARPRPAVGEAVIASWKKAGLIKPSVFKPLLATVERKLGHLEPEDLNTLREVLRTILGGKPRASLGQPRSLPHHSRLLAWPTAFRRGGNHTCPRRGWCRAWPHCAKPNIRGSHMKLSGT